MNTALILLSVCLALIGWAGITPASALAATPTLAINELMAANGSSVSDPQGDFDDWIEIHNYGARPVDIGGMYLTDDLQRPDKWRIPVGIPEQTTLAAFGYLLIWADNEAAQGPLHAPFKLSGSGEEVGLFDASLGSIDSVHFGPLAQDIAYGRVPDGAGAWTVLPYPTPGRPNRLGAVRIAINEIMYHPPHPAGQGEDPNAEYIELFNPDSVAVDLSGWSLSGGVNFIFPAFVLDGQSYVVVAADMATFQENHPGVASAVGPWEKRLSNKSETVTLRDAAGVRVDQVTYADQGDWGWRELGPVDYHHRGWQWIADHDGGGASLELINPALVHDAGANWRASLVQGGTPGRMNSVAADNIAPLLLDLVHEPAVPLSTETVTVTVRVLDESAHGLEVVLCHRPDDSAYTDRDLYPQDTTAAFQRVTMQDDGLHGDGQAGDGVYGAVLSPEPNDTVVEFYVQATDDRAQTRTWPAPSWVDGQLRQVTNALYQVDDRYVPADRKAAGAEPLYRIVLTRAERDRLIDIGDTEGGEYNSNAQMNATFISDDGGDVRVRYGVGIRNRGNGSRNDPPNNYRIDFRHDQSWKGVTAINFNTYYPHIQAIGSALFRLAGLPAAQVDLVQVRVNGDNLALTGSRMYGSYARVEVLDSDFVSRWFPDNQGNLYKCMRMVQPGAGLRYEGSEPGPYRRNYFKHTNVALDDWRDLIALTWGLSDTASDKTYSQAVSEVLDVDQWLHAMAINILVANNETTLATGDEDDYYLYNPFPDAPRFLLIPYDLDTILGMGSNPGSVTDDPFRMTKVPTMARFMEEPRFAQRYQETLLELADSLFSESAFTAVLRQTLGGKVPETVINQMQGFMADRLAYLRETLQVGLTIETGLVNKAGCDYTATPWVDLTGTADPAHTATVLVQGRPTLWSPLSAQWILGHEPVTQKELALRPGINRIRVHTVGPDDPSQVLEQAFVDIWYDDGDMGTLAGTLSSDRTLIAAEGPWHVTSDVIVPAGTCLTVEAGTTIFFEPKTGMTVTDGGCLRMEGEPYAPIHLTRVPAAADVWDGLRFENSLEDNRLVYVDQSFGNGQGESVDVQHSRVLLDHVTWSDTDERVLNVDHPTAWVRDCVFPPVNGTEPIHGVGLVDDEALVFERCVFGMATGNNDIIDFSGGQRPGPILQMYDSLFLGGSDDGLDLDGTDAHIEGNTFTGFHRGGSSDTTSNAIATGTNGGQSAHLVVARNLFVRNDHAVLLKEDSFMTAQNNTFADLNVAAVSFGEPDRNPPRTPGLGGLLESNIFWNNTDTFENFYQTPHPDYGPEQVSIQSCLIPSAWHDLGPDNRDADPLFVTPGSDYRLLMDSPALQVNGAALTQGATVPAGATIRGEPASVTYRRSAELHVSGPGIVAYTYSLNDPNGPWSEVRDMDMPIELADLTDGASYRIYALGQNSAGRWQTLPTVSRAWTVDVTSRSLAINEIQVRHPAPDGETSPPGFIELAYDGPEPLSLAGMSLKRDPHRPEAIVLGEVVLNPGDYWTLMLDSTPNGFDLDARGDGLYLLDRDASLLDTVTFGPQVAGASIGRVGRDGQWLLTEPTPGQVNRPMALGDHRQVRINEWLAFADTLFPADFIELYNPKTRPVAIGGWSLTDNPVGRTVLSTWPALSFVPGSGFLVVDADAAPGPGHVGFKLSADGEMIALIDTSDRIVDQVVYGPQVPDVSEGRAPDGGDTLLFFAEPTPGQSNPYAAPPVSETQTEMLFDFDQIWHFDQTGISLPGDWYGKDFDDRSWPAGPGLLYVEGSTLPAPKKTALTLGQITYYFRTHFSVTDPTAILTLSAQTVVDDGVIVYLNGHEVLRLGMPAGSIGNNTHADRTVGDAALEGPFAIDSRYLLPGDNVLAAEVHQVNSTSSDIVFGLMLTAEVALSPGAGASAAPR